MNVSYLIWAAYAPAIAISLGGHGLSAGDWFLVAGAWLSWGLWMRALTKLRDETVAR